MGFRDDEVAARARIDSLEQRVREVERENARLRGGRPAEARPIARMAPALVAGIGVLLMGGAAYSGLVLVGGASGHIMVVLAVLSVTVLWLAMLLGIVQSLLVVARPHEVLVLSGRRALSADGRTRGYRVVIGGRTLRVPLLERLDRLDTTPLSFERSLRGVAIAGSASADLRIRGTVRIVPREPLVHQAIERFVGAPADRIAEAATEIVERVARDVVVGRTKEALRVRRDEVREAVLDATNDALCLLGLELDELRIEVEVAP